MKKSNTVARSRTGKAFLFLSVAAVGIALVWAIATGVSHAKADVEGPMTGFKDPNCGCCAGYVGHLRRAGYEVQVKNVADIMMVKRMAGVPEGMGSCHTTTVGRYVIEGHVPLDVVEEFLEAEPDVRGIALPGMPMGSPGMNGPKTEPFVIQSFGKDGDTGIFATR